MERFREKLDLPYPMVGDADRVIMKSYGAKWPLVGLARRVTFIVRPDRTIALAHHREFDIPSHVDACGPIEAARPYHEGASFVEGEDRGGRGPDA